MVQQTGTECIRLFGNHPKGNDSDILLNFDIGLRKDPGINLRSETVSLGRPVVVAFSLGRFLVGFSGIHPSSLVLRVFTA